MSEMLAKIEELEAQVAELELQIDEMHEEFAELEEQFDAEIAELDEEMEAVAEEALLAGYELGYLQSAVKTAEKQVFLAEAANAFDEIMVAPEVVDGESIEDLVAEIDAFDAELFDDEDEWEEEEYLDEEDCLDVEEEEALFEENELDEEQSEDAVTASEVAAAIRSWVGHVKAEEVAEQEELELA